MKKNFLSFENKVLITFTFILALGLSAINLVAVLFFKYSIEGQIYRESRLYMEVYRYNPSVRLPEYIKLFDRLPDSPSYEIIGMVNGRYVTLDKEYKTRKTKEFATTLLMWDAVLILSTMLLIYFTIIKYIKKEEYLRRYLEILILTITHKLGNFLSVQRINIDLIKSKCRIKAVNRLESAYSLIEKDFKFTIRTLKNLGNAEKNIKTVNLKDLVEDILHHFIENLKDRDVITRLKNIYIKIDPNDIENILFTVIENAVKFSEKRIHIKMCSDGKYVYIFIKNDVGTVNKGAGIGLEIAEFLISQYGGEIKTHIGRDFLTVLKIPL
ncbi:sensor histidine kinase [Persephonella sp.]|nr:HAMP domain-containing histidine kinase [Aquificota bacterium]